MIISKQRINELVEILINKIDINNINQIVGIKNGGLHISKLLARKLHLPHASVYISRYNGKKIREKPIIKGSLFPSRYNLIVDDLVDSGETFKLFDEYFGLEGNFTAVLFWNPDCHFIPDYFAEIKPNEWLIFPWEQV
jgi:hypoxanthine phosphoribosyltransferase